MCAGIVTTTRVTHASPAGTYAHTAHRDWEADADVAASCAAAHARQDDIALQLVHAYPGDHFKVPLTLGIAALTDCILRPVPAL